MSEYLARVNNWYCISILGILLLAILFFSFLEKEKKRKPEFFLPFVLTANSVFYEFLGGATIVFLEINKWLYGIFNYPHENNYNLWVYNFFGYHLTSMLFLALIYQYLYSPIKRKIVKGMALFFILFYTTFQVLGIESLFEQQPYSIMVGFSAVIIACGLYFMELISHPDYLEINPLRSFSFWQVTVILFNGTLKFLLEISYNYIISVSIELMKSLYLISTVSWMVILITFLITIALNTRFFTPKTVSYD